MCQRRVVIASQQTGSILYARVRNERLARSVKQQRTRNAELTSQQFNKLLFSGLESK
jgi:hypothetical protein